MIKVQYNAFIFAFKPPFWIYSPFSTVYGSTYFPWDILTNQLEYVGSQCLLWGARICLVKSEGIRSDDWLSNASAVLCQVYPPDLAASSPPLNV